MSTASPTADLGMSRDIISTTAPQRRPAPPGPVFIGDIHGQWGGQPMLLHLWALWDAARDADQ